MSERKGQHRQMSQRREESLFNELYCFSKEFRDKVRENPIANKVVHMLADGVSTYTVIEELIKVADNQHEEIKRLSDRPPVYILKDTKFVNR